ncbi:MAG TPA: hypothetical protein ENK27_03960 [Desulfobulbus sp.]|nr:hypothetical protein [Desulfobulbus sp.]
MDSYPPRFDQLYSISDLHLGGRQGFQMFAQGPLLAGVIDRLRENMAAEERLALVINGDFIDFLAEHPDRYFNHQGAVADLERVMADPAFAPVFEALARFVATPGNVLVINLGNHDLELCLPAVQHALLSRLAGDDPVARDRIHIIADGSGYCCRVGGCKALFVHGNETDAWNRVDFSDLLAIRAAYNSGREPKTYRANIGTRLVIDILNEIKTTYRFVDLLKPELPLALAVLYSVMEDRSRLGRWLLRLPGVFLDLSYLPILSVLNGEEARELPGEVTEPLQELRDMLAVIAPAPDDAALLETAWQHYVEKTPPDDFDDPAARLSERRLRDLAWYSRSLMAIVDSPWKRAERLRKTLRETLKEDRSFEISSPDKISRKRAAIAGDAIHFLVAGHTHLRRSITLSSEQHYFNSGTWTDLLCFPAPLLEDEKRFFVVYEALRKGLPPESLEELERKMVRKEYTLVHIRAKDNGAVGQLLQAGSDGDLVPVNHSSRQIRMP